MSAFAVAGLVMAFAAVFGAVIYWSHQIQKKRREALQQLATEMRWSFSSEGDDSLLMSMSGFHLFSIGSSRRLTNLMRGSMKDRKATLFDYRYTTGGGKHRHTSHFTVLCLNAGGRPLPRFAIRPEELWHKIGSALGYKDIDFERYPEFSKKYLLRGDDEFQIRDLFRDSVIRFFEQNPGLSAEGNAESLILHRQKGQLKPEDIRGFIELGSRLLLLLRP